MGSHISLTIDHSHYLPCGPITLPPRLVSHYPSDVCQSAAGHTSSRSCQRDYQETSKRCDSVSSEYNSQNVGRCVGPEMCVIPLKVKTATNGKHLGWRSRKRRRSSIRLGARNARRSTAFKIEQDLSFDGHRAACILRRHLRCGVV